MLLFAIGYPIAAIVWARRRIGMLIWRDAESTTTEQGAAASGRHAPQSQASLSAERSGAKVLTVPSSRASGDIFQKARVSVTSRALHQSMSPLQRLLLPVDAWSAARRRASVASSSRPRAIATTALPPVLTATAVIDSSLPVRADAALAPFVAGDYRPSAYWFYALDRYTLLALTVIGTVVGTPASTVDAASKLALTVLVLVCGFTAFVLVRPYPPLAAWKLVVKLYSLALSMLAAILNCVVVVAPSSSAMLPLAYIVFSGSIGLFITLLIAFIASAVRPPPRDRAAALLRQQRKLATLGSTNPLLAGKGRGRAAIHQMLPSAAPASAHGETGAATTGKRLSMHKGATAAAMSQAQPGRITRRVARMSRMSVHGDAGLVEPDAGPRKVGRSASKSPSRHSQSSGATESVHSRAGAVSHVMQAAVQSHAARAALSLSGGGAGDYAGASGARPRASVTYTPAPQQLKRR